MGLTIGNALAATVNRIWGRTDYFLQPVIGVGGKTKDNRISARPLTSLLCFSWLASAERTGALADLEGGGVTGVAPPPPFQISKIKESKKQSKK